MKDLEKMFDTALDIVSYVIGRENIETITRPISINRRAKSRWGSCTRSKVGIHKIEISSRILEDSVPDDATMSTIIHEILHACKNGSGHRGQWSVYADMINRKTHYHITRTTSASTFGITVEKVNINRHKYGCKCETCGKIIYKSKMTKFIKNPSVYIHRNCGGHFIRVI